MAYLYKKAILGGTFDHFHSGHEALLTAAFTTSEHVTIGLTQHNMYQQKFLASTIESYESRKTKLQEYLQEKEYSNRCLLIPISDIYGTTLEDATIEAIFVTEENLSNTNRINHMRAEKGFQSLQVVLVPYVKDNEGKIITSERIRKGEIDRNGFVYKNIFTRNELILPESLRPQLRQPLGKLVSTTDEVLPFLEKKSVVICVGDIVSNEIKKIGIELAISIIDFKTRRHDLPRMTIQDVHTAQNKQGTISKEAVSVFLNAKEVFLKTGQSQTVVIEGEEDLLTLPAILLSPLGGIVLYGQFEQGIVVNRVTEELKNRIRGIIKKFD